MKQLLILLICVGSVFAFNKGDVCKTILNSNGRSLDVYFFNLDSGGTWNFGMGALHKSYHNAKGKLAVKRLGFTSQGAPTTLIDTVYMDTVEFKLYPASTATTNQDSAVVYGTVGDPDSVKLTIALSSVIYSKDTIKYINIGSGLYTKSGTPNNAYTNTTVDVNNSTEVYPKAIFKWNWPDRRRVTGSNIDVYASAFHLSGRNKLPVRTIKFTANDSHGDTVTVWDSTMTYNTTFPDSSKCTEFYCNLPTTSLTTLDTIIVNAWAFPWYGDTSASTNTADGVNAYPSPYYTKQVYLLDKSNTYGVTCGCVDSVSGDDASGAVSDTSVYLDGSGATCYKHIANALNAIAAYNNTNHSRNDCGGGCVFLKNSHFFTGGTLSAGAKTMPKTWVRIKPFAGLTTKDVALVGNGTSGDYKNYPYLKIQNVTFNGTGNYCLNTGKRVWLDQDSINASGSYQFHDLGNFYITDCKILKMNGTTGAYPAVACASQIDLLRGNWFNLAGSFNIKSVHNVIGNLSIGGNISFQTSYAGSLSPQSKEYIIAFNKFYHLSATLNSAPPPGDSANDTTANGIAIVQNIFEKITTTTPLLQLAADGSTSLKYSHVVNADNTLPGERLNIFYNDPSARDTLTMPLKWRKNNLLLNNNLDRYSVVGGSELHGGSPHSWTGLYGGFYSKYGTNGSGNCIGSFAVKQYFRGISSNDTAGQTIGDLDFKYVSNRSYTGTAAGNGDYHLNSNSPAIGITINEILPYDLDGNTRYIGGASGAYEWVPAPIINTQPTNQTIKSGSTASFSISAIDSSGTLQYKLKRKYPGSSWAYVAGATSNSYTTGTFTNDSSGTKYQFNVYTLEGADSTFSDSITVTVNSVQTSLSSENGFKPAFKPAFLAAFRRAFR